MTDQDALASLRLHLRARIAAMEQALRDPAAMLGATDEQRAAAEAKIEERRAWLGAVEMADYERSGCPCLGTTPCLDNCTCMQPFSSRGCNRCARYGSAEQRRAGSEWLASVIDAAYKARAERQS